jgi:hypothetical protein
LQGRDDLVQDWQNKSRHHRLFDPLPTHFFLPTLGERRRPW